MSRTFSLRFLGLIRPWAVRIAFGAAAAALSGALYLIVPMALRTMLATFAGGDQRAKVHAVGVGIAYVLSIAVAQSVLSYVQSMLLAGVSAGMTRELRQRLVAHVLRLPLRVCGAERVGVFLARYSADVPIVVSLATATLPSLVRAGGLIIGLTIVLFVLSWKLTFVTAGIIGIVAAVSNFLLRRTTKISRPLQAIRTEALAFLGEVIANIPLIRTFGRNDTIVGRMTAHLDSAYELSIRAARLGAISGSLVNAIGGFMVCTVLCIGATSALSGTVTLPAILAYLAASGMLAGALGTFAANLNTIATSLAALERYLCVLEIEPELDGQTGLAPPIRGMLSFEHVSFSYRGDVPVLQDVSLEIPAGTSVAIVGPSGSGKSTILQLVLAAFVPQNGRIVLDGHDVQTIATTWLRDRIGYVPQEPYVFHGTIAENLRFGKLDASESELRDACRIARFDTVLGRFERGFEEHIGERASTLSRGEAQRLAIARMILRDPAIVLLDEATASLDAENERLVLEALHDALRGRTTITVTHRLENAMRSDVVAILYEGRLIERGTPSELLRRGGMFARLVAASTHGHDYILDRTAPLRVAVL